MRKHKLHIVPRHMGGGDEPENLIELSVEDHALAHKELWEKHGLEEDRIAWLALSGQMTMTEAKILSQEAGRLRGSANVKDHRSGAIANLKKNPHIHSLGGKARAKKMNVKGYWKWVTNEVKDTKVPYKELDSFLKENPTYRRGRCYLKIQKP